MISVVVSLRNPLNIGDCAHADAIHKALLKANPKIIWINVDVNNSIAKIIEEVKTKTSEYVNERIIIIVGEKGIVAIDSLNKQKLLGANFFLCASIHQYFNEIKSLSSRIDFLAIPESAIDSPRKKQIVESIKNYTYTLGVPTSNPDIKTLEKSYNDWQVPNKPSLDKPYIIAVLPGDAPAANNKMKYFTKDSAAKLFEDIFGLWKKYGSKHSIIIHNGPRTGKFDPVTGEIACAHEYNKGGDAAIAEDEVSKEFVSLLKQNNMPYYFYNFAFEKDGASKKVLSALNPLIYISTKNESNFFIVPGESVSMISQMPLYLEASHIVVFKPSSMNAQHKKILDDFVKRGYLSYFSKAGKVISPKNPVKMTKDDADLVASGIIKAYEG